jgi:hypothetical protein
MPQHTSNSNAHADSPIRTGTADAVEILEGSEEILGDEEDLEAGRGEEQMQRQVYYQPVGSEDVLGQEQLYSSDRESEVDFASEHSGGESDTEEDESPCAYMTRKLYEQLQGGHHGCTDEEHEASRRQHMNAAGDNHHGLRAVFDDPRFPSVLGFHEMISPERLARQPRPQAAQWETIFCGVPRQGRQRLPMNICLHEEATQAVEADVAFDFDSLLFFANSPAAARKGFWYQPAPQMRQNMTADNHLGTTLFDDGQPGRGRTALIRDVPHFLLGRVEGAHDITAYALFPHLSVAGGKFVSLTQEQLTRWVDLIYLPAIHQFYDAHYTQHLPANFRNAYHDSKAHQVEARQVQTASYQAQQCIGYHLQAEHLDEIWNEILRIIEGTPGLADFRDPELFFTAKGTKLQFKRPTLLEAMDHFQDYLEDVLDFRYIQLDRLYVDVGKEICANVSLAQLEQPHIGDEAHVYLWKRCCQETYIRWMYDGEPPPKGGRGRLYFTQNMLHDAGSLTSVAPKQSKHWKGGLVYSQFYSSAKELYDATKCFPFSNDAMEELALDPQIRNAARHTAGGNRRDAKVVETAYLASKRRTSGALQGARKKSFGIREEHRIRWDLFQSLRARLRFHEHEGVAVTMSDCPSYVWAVKTDAYLDFLWRSADKFAAGFEVVRAQCRGDLITWEQTKMMAMFLRCLRYVFGGHLLSRESALWWSRRERRVGAADEAAESARRQRVWYGLGFGNTLAKYGYCWLEPRVDWGRLQFKSEVTDSVLFGNSILRGQYLRRGGQVQAFFNTTRRLDLALEWLDRYGDNGTVRERMVSWMVHLCLQQFRVDVLRTVSAEIVAERRDEVLRGDEGLSYEYLDEVMIAGFYLMCGNKTDFKEMSNLGHFLFDWEDGLIRKHWEDRAFRVIYRRVRTGLGQRNGGVAEVFDRRFWRWIFKYHWVLPYPCGNGLLQTTKQGRRMWYSIQRDGEGEWKWGRKGWQTGRPEALPEYIGWGKEEWEEWIDGQIREG